MGRPGRGDPLAGLTDYQRAVVISPARFKALLWGRRTGKTDCEKRVYASGLVSTLPAEADAENIFIGLTADTAARNLWRPLVRLDRQLGLGLKFDASKMRVTGWNGSVLQVAGSETVRDLEKPRGGGYRRAFLDECGAMRPSSLEYLVTDVLEPAMMDDPEAEMWLSGSPGTVPVGFWHDVTTGKLPGWEVSRHTADENPHVDYHRFVYGYEDPVRGHVKGLLERRGWDEKHPKFLREYRAQWAIDPTNLVYRFDATRNVVRELPQLLHRRDRWRTVIGLDFGVNNATALVVIKYSELYGRAAFVVHAWRKVGLAPSEAAALIAKAIAEYKPDVIVGDTGGMGLAFVQEFNRRYPRMNGWIKAAKKADKRARLEFMSDALAMADLERREGLFLVRPERLIEVVGEDTEAGLAELQTELSTLEWDKDREDIEEGQDDDVANACQYAFGEVPGFENDADAPEEKTQQQQDEERATRGDDEDEDDRPGRAYYEETD